MKNKYESELKVYVQIGGKVRILSGKVENISQIRNLPKEMGVYVHDRKGWTKVKLEPHFFKA